MSAIEMFRKEKFYLITDKGFERFDDGCELQISFNLEKREIKFVFYDTSIIDLLKLKDLIKIVEIRKRELGWL